MSYILEALKKAEKERKLGKVPGIDSTHEAAPGSVSPRWVWIALSVIFINVVLVLSLFWSERGKNPDAVSPLQSEPALHILPQQQRKTVAPAIAEAQPAIAPVRPPVQPTPEMIRAPKVRMEAAMPHVEPAGRTASRVPATPITQAVAAAPPPADESELPVWPQVPGNLFQKIRGGLRLDVHVYGPHSSDRFVLINLQKYYEGDELQEGPTLDEITQEGVVLSFQGQRFRVQAQ